MTPAWLRDLGGADPYQLLDVPRDASTETIVRAHRRRIRDLHPDRISGDAAQARLVNQARDILLDPLRRAELDRLADQPAELYPTADQPSAWDAEDVLAGAEPEPAAAWETEDVIVGAEPAPPPPVSPAPPASPHYQAPYYHAPYPGQYPSYPPGWPAPQPSLGLPIAALVCAFMCTPLGLILGILGLRQHRGLPGSGRALSIAAIAVSGGSLLLVCLCYGGAMLASVSA